MRALFCSLIQVKNNLARYFALNSKKILQKMTNEQKDSAVFLGVDVGTASVRSLAIGYPSRDILATSSKEITINSPRKDHFEQSSEEIWQACLETVGNLLNECKFGPSDIKGIGFDATCSLVFLDSNGTPLSVTKEIYNANDTASFDVIMWMDHRAMEETEEINSAAHLALQVAGSKISPEMEPPKLLWMKRHKPEIWKRVGHFMDLADYLTFKATGSTTRSLCTLGCKWLYKTVVDVSPTSENGSWDYDFYNSIGLADLFDCNCSKIGSTVQVPGTPISHGLSPSVASKLGLPAGIPVATSVIDAHAGALGALASVVPNYDLPNIENRLPVICGTSTCHMALSSKPISVPGITGPVFSAVVPGFYLNEAGQNAVGNVFDMLVTQNKDLFLSIQPFSISKCHKQISSELSSLPLMSHLSKNVHVFPDYRGNRTPISDSEIRAAVMGLEFWDDRTPFEERWRQLLAMYLAHAEAFAFETRHIIETLESSSHPRFQMLLLCGGLQKNPIYVRAHADICQLPVVIVNCPEPVALGAAVLGAYASGKLGNFSETVEKLGQNGTVLEPNREMKDFYNTKYGVFKKLMELVIEAKEVMKKY